MRDLLPEILEHGRVKQGDYASAYGMKHGAFMIIGPNGPFLKIVSSGDDLWEHVSVSLKHRCPNWQEMCYVKDLFWGDDECVIQYHPPRKDYINIHPNVLHLWKPPVPIPMPPKEAV